MPIRARLRKVTLEPRSVTPWRLSRKAATGLTARQAFPLAAFEDVPKWRKARWREEILLRALHLKFVARMQYVTGVQDPALWTTSEVGMDYTDLADGFSALMKACQRNKMTWDNAVLKECVENTAIHRAARILGLAPITLESLGLMMRCKEFAGWRRDQEFLACLGAEQEAIERLPTVMAQQIVREHRHTFARRKLGLLTDLEELAREEAMADGVTGTDVDELLNEAAQMADLEVKPQDTEEGSDG